MPTYADLEIGLHRRDADSYTVELRFTPPDSDADVRLLEESPVLTFDVKALRQHHLNDEDYGQTLAGALFGQKQEPVNIAFEKARQSRARGRGCPAGAALHRPQRARTAQPALGNPA